MKKQLSFVITALLVLIVSTSAIAEDIYVYYSIKGPKGPTVDTKVYSKNGDARMEVIIDMAGMKMTTASLVLKSNPNEMIVLNSLAKSYTKRAIPKKKPNLQNYSITVIGKEKVGAYNCTRVRVKSNDKSYDMWCTKDLPMLNVSIENYQASINKKLADELAKKGVSGLMVKIVYFNTGTTVPKLIMELMKYETKPLNASLFKIPSDYKESKGNPYRDASPEKRKELTKQLMEQLKAKGK
ncbi:MAG: DUF4412 domain-containing protein [Chitinophagaceae bacterium]|nr:MAG: DUF4412 domain-containing protein [Chitinophagaceae bacterium]